MALAFLMLAAPLVALGLPGSFGRYLEFYRQRGQLPSVLRRTAIVCVATAVGVAIAMMAAHDWVAQLVFGRSESLATIVLLATALALVVVYNYLTELLTALRLMRAAAIVQLAHSLLFAVLAISLILTWRADAQALILAFAGACLLPAAAMLPRLRRLWARLQSQSVPLGRGDLWRRLLPFAVWVWVTNLLFNLFDVADRYMIVHFAPQSDPLQMVGDYHCARIVPMLMVSVAALLAGMIMPHLSQHWEAGRRDRVVGQVNLAIKLLSLALTLGSIVVLLGAGALFEAVFGGKFAGGRAVLPWTLVYCAWMSLALMTQTYLWCAERARLGCAAIVVGLMVNVALNLALLPRLGLLGAVLATSAANLAALMLLAVLATRRGMCFDRGAVWLAGLPAAAALGPLPAALLLAAAAALAWRTNWLFNAAEKRELSQIAQGYWLNVRNLLGRKASSGTLPLP
jgi:PST family polysaccharide transporter